MQNKNEQILANLIAENPTLRIIPIVHTNVVQDDEHRYWKGRMGTPYLDYIYTDKYSGITYLKSDSWEDIRKYFFDDNSNAESFLSLTNKEKELRAKAFFEHLPWEYVIVERILKG